MNMNVFFHHICRSLVIGLFAGLVAVVGSTMTAPEAHACDQALPHYLTLDLLRSATPENINQLISEDYAQWEDREVSFTVTSIRRVLTVIEAEPGPESYASTGGVEVTEAVWGEPGDIGPGIRGFDNTNCFFSAAPLAEHRWYIDTDPYNVFEFDSGDRGNIDALEVELTRLFGEPVRPERDAAAEDEALQALLERGDEIIDGDIASIQKISIGSGEVGDIGNERRRGGFAWLTVLLIAVAAGAVAASAWFLSSRSQQETTG